MGYMDDEIELIRQGAFETLSNLGDHSPLFIGYDKDGEVFLGVVVIDDDTKHKIYPAMKSFILDNKITRFIWVMDTYLLRDVKPPINKRPRDHPERESAIVAWFYNKLGCQRVHLFFYDEDNYEITEESDVDADNYESIIDNLRIKDLVQHLDGSEINDE